MWTVTTQGFFSAVQHRDDPDLLVVRTRDHGDAETLTKWYAAWQGDMAKIGHALPGQSVPLEGPTPTITSYEWSDYPWRVIMPRTAWAAFLAEAAEDLDYGNFKDEVKTIQGPARAQVYSRVWGVLLDLEDLDPMGRRAVVVEDEPWGQHYGWEARREAAEAALGRLQRRTLAGDMETLRKAVRAASHATWEALGSNAALLVVGVALGVAWAGLLAAWFNLI